MRAVIAISFVLASLGVGCALVPKPEVEVEAVNRTSRELRNAEARFGDHACGWGYLIPSATKGWLFFPYPITAEATIVWDDDVGHHSEKVDLRGIYPSGASGRLTFTMLDARVAATFRRK